MFSLNKPLLLSHGHNLNKLGRGPLGDVTLQTLTLEALWFNGKEDAFHVFPI